MEVIYNIEITDSGGHDRCPVQDFLADLIGVSAISEDHYTREFGVITGRDYGIHNGVFYSTEPTQGAFWIVEVDYYDGSHVDIKSNYNIIDLGCRPDLSFTPNGVLILTRVFILHPHPDLSIEILGELCAKPDLLVHGDGQRWCCAPIAWSRNSDEVRVQNVRD